MAEEIFNTIYENLQNSNIHVIKLKQIYSKNKRTDYYIPNYEYTKNNVFGYYINVKIDKYRYFENNQFKGERIIESKCIYI